MRERALALLKGLAAFGILLGPLIMPLGALGANVARDLKVIDGEEMRKLVVLLEAAPRYSVKSVDGRGVFFTLLDTAPGPLLAQKTRGAPDSIITIEKGEKSPDLTFHIMTALPVREIRSAWLSPEKLLVLEISPGKETGKKSEQGAVLLNRFRFGARGTMTRMVMDLNGKPDWEMAYREADRLTLTLKAAPGTMRKRRYGPFRRVKGLDIRNKDHRQEIGIRLERPLDHFRLFWLQDGNRLVMDLFDQTPEMTDEIRLMPPKIKEIEKKEGPNLGEEKATVQVDSGGTAQNRERVSHGERRGNRPDSDRPDKANEAPASGSGSRVRMKIHQDGGKDPVQSEEAPTPIHPTQPVRFEIEADAEKILSERFSGGDALEKLSSGEAFLFGRIQEAWEIKDFEKGSALADRFLRQFPDSLLGEKIAFLRGDFLLALLKDGKKDLLPKVIKGYQEAARLYRKSGEVPAAFVRMAQANASMGLSFEAIGFLNIAIEQYPEGDHLPQAYLTRGKLYLATHQPQKAVQDFRTLLTRFPRSPQIKETRFWKAEYLHSVGLYGEAEETLKKIEDADPEFYTEQPGFLSLRAKNYFFQKRYDLARDYYFRALNLGRQPESEDILLSHIGDTYHHEAAEGDAEIFYRAAVDRYPDSEGASIAGLRLADYSSGVSMFNEIHQRNLDRSVGDLALLKLANRFYEKGAYPMAMDTLQKVMEKSPAADIQRESRRLFHRAAEKEIGRLYRAGDHQGLLRFFQSVRDHVDGKIDPEALHLMAQSLYEVGRDQEAVTLFSGIKPYDLSLTARGRYVLSLTECYLRLGDQKSAEGLLEGNRREKLLPTDHQRITILLADLRRKRGNLEDAYHLYETQVQAKRALPDIEIARVYLAMGEIANLEKRYEQSREALNRCIALAEKEKEGPPLLRSAFVEMGNTFYREGKHRQAAEAFERGLDLGYGPENAGYWETNFHLALCYLETGNEVEARRLLQEIADEGDPLLQQKVLIKLGQIDLLDQLKRLPMFQEGPVTI